MFNLFQKNFGIAVLPDPPTGDYINPIPRRVGVVQVYTLGSIINWILTGKLVPYLNNRGNGMSSQKTTASAYAGVKGDSLGECTIGIYNGELTLADFHSRLNGFCRRYVDGLMTVRELKTPISVRVAGDFLSAYRELNGGDPHCTKHKIANPDLAYGSIIQSISTAVGPDCMKLIGQNKWTVLSSIIYNLSYCEDRNWSWPAVYRFRQVSMKLANNEAGSLVISASDKRYLIQAIKYWYDLMVVLNNRAKETDNNVKKIIGNAGLFGFIVCDRMWATPTFSTPPVMVKKIIRNLPAVQRACPELCRSNKDTMIEYSLQLNQIFKKSAA